MGSAKLSSKLTESEEVGDKDAPQVAADEEAAGAAAAANAGAQGAAVPGSSKEKDTAKEVLPPFDEIFL